MKKILFLILFLFTRSGIAQQLHFINRSIDNNGLQKIVCRMSYLEIPITIELLLSHSFFLLCW